MKSYEKYQKIDDVFYEQPKTSSTTQNHFIGNISKLSLSNKENKAKGLTPYSGFAFKIVFSSIAPRKTLFSIFLSKLIS